MTEDYQRAIRELQGAASELIACAIAGRRTDEAAPDLERATKRAELIADDCRRLAAQIDHAVRTVRAVVEAVAR